MIILDSNVISEAMRPRPDPAAVSGLNGHAAQTLYLSSVTLAEMLFGIGALPVGARKDRLARALDALLALFPGRTLPFDTDAARRYAQMAVVARAAGRRFRRRTATSPRPRPPTASPSPPGTSSTSRTPASNSSTPAQRLTRKPRSDQRSGGRQAVQEDRRP
jgi:hypothetical protein